MAKTKVIYQTSTGKIIDNYNLVGDKVIDNKTKITYHINDLMPTASPIITRH